MTTKFQPLNTADLITLRNALIDTSTGNVALKMCNDTSFQGTTHQKNSLSFVEETEDAEVINAIKSQPCHYSGEKFRGPTALLDAKGAPRFGRYHGLLIVGLAYGKTSIVTRDPSAAVGAIWVEYA